MSAICTACEKALVSLLVCEECGSIQAAGQDLNPFEVLGLEQSIEIEHGAVRKRLLRLSRLTHPDFFTAEPAELQELAEHASAQLNAASKQLDDPIRRADWLVNELGGPKEEEDRQMPQAFLMEVLEWNETLEEAKQAGTGNNSELDALESELDSQRSDLLASLIQTLTPLPERGGASLAGLRRTLNAVRYIDRTLGEIRNLRLPGASSSR
ncbi:MAG: molecular chaperone HscB [Planctomycetota bacterium]|jgi:molecular chaperone HscB